MVRNICIYLKEHFLNFLNVQTNYVTPLFNSFHFINSIILILLFTLLSKLIIKYLN